MGVAFFYWHRAVVKQNKALADYLLQINNSLFTAQ